jgi:V/A-type H+/Na+-transporting ATPase subunit G/H
MVRNWYKSKSSNVVNNIVNNVVTGVSVGGTEIGFQAKNRKMEDQLKRLLEAEARAQSIIEAASTERQRMLDQALAGVHEAEARFEANRVNLRAPFLKEAHGRAEQAAAELTRKYEERQRNLRSMASRHEQEAVDAALSLLLDPAV